MDVQHAVAARGQCGVVGHKHQRCAVVAVAPKQQLDDLLPRGLVEIAGWFVGDNDGGIWRDRARQRDALLFAARKLHRIVVQPIGEPHRLEQRPRARLAIAFAVQFIRQQDILKSRQRRNQLIRLKDEPNRFSPHLRQLILRQIADRCAVQMHVPCAWRVEPGQQPEFDEYTVVLKGSLHVESKSGVLEVKAGQAVISPRGEWVRYSTPGPDGAEYIAVCLAAFDPATVHRDETATT